MAGDENGRPTVDKVENFRLETNKSCNRQVRLHESGKKFLTVVVS